MHNTSKYFIFPVLMLLTALLVAFPLAAHAKDKIIIGQAVSLSGPLATSNSVVSTPYYDLWVHDVNAEGAFMSKNTVRNYP